MLKKIIITIIKLLNLISEKTKIIREKKTQQPK